MSGSLPEHIRQLENLPPSTGTSDTDSGVATIEPPSNQQITGWNEAMHMAPDDSAVTMQDASVGDYFGPFSNSLSLNPVAFGAFFQGGEADDGEDSGYRISDVNQVDLAVFFSQYEDSEHIAGQDFSERYLTNPQMMSFQNDIISDLVDRAQTGEPPLTREEFYQMALEETGDPGTALMVSHNVTKALSRGRSPIDWEKQSTEPLEYSFDGQTETFDPADFHSDAAVAANGEPSVFYAMFSQDDIGTDDPGDFYHFYLNAATTYYSASGELTYNDDGAWNPLDYSRAVDNAINGTMEQMGDAPSSDAYDGWRFANSLSYLEGAKYGGDYGGAQESLNRESDVHREGAIFGLRQAGVEPDPSWRWYGPEVGAASGQYDTDVNLSEDTYGVYDVSGEPVSEDGDPSEAQNDGDGGSSRGGS